MFLYKLRAYESCICSYTLRSGLVKGPKEVFFLCSARFLGRSSLLHNYIRIFGAVLLTLDNKFNLQFIIVRSHLSG